MTAPAIDRLLSLTGQHVARTETVTADGDVATVDAPPVPIPCYVERGATTELRDGQEVVISNWRGFFLPTFAAKAGDGLVLGSGPDGYPLRLEFVGPTQPITNPLVRYVHHVEARLREVE